MSVPSQITPSSLALHALPAFALPETTSERQKMNNSIRCLYGNIRTGDLTVEDLQRLYSSGFKLRSGKQVESTLPIACERETVVVDYLNTVCAYFRALYMDEDIQIPWSSMMMEYTLPMIKALIESYQLTYNNCKIVIVIRSNPRDMWRLTDEEQWVVNALSIAYMGWVEFHVVSCPESVPLDSSRPVANPEFTTPDHRSFKHDQYGHDDLVCILYAAMTGGYMITKDRSCFKSFTNLRTQIGSFTLTVVQNARHIHNTYNMVDGCERENMYVAITDSYGGPTQKVHYKSIEYINVVEPDFSAHAIYMDCSS